MYQEIIKFWFEDIEPSKWWIKDVEFDELLRTRFLDVHKKAINCELFEWRETSMGALAEIIVLDQFSRNMFRDDPRSFAYDSLSLALAQSAIARGFDMDLSKEKRGFLYMPFMHSESLAIHNGGESLFLNLGNKSSIEFERKHKAIIEKFGRYPHRNKILGRTSSLDEIAFLQTSGSSF